VSLRSEQYHSLKNTRKFLHDLIMSNDTPEGIAKEAYHCAYHFPALDEQGQPIWSLDDLTEDREDVQRA